MVSNMSSILSGTREQARTGARVLALVLAAACGAGLAWAPAVEAQQPGAQKRETRATPAMRESVYRELSAAQTAADNGDAAEAVRLLDRVQQRKDLNSYELAQLYNFYAFIYYSQDQYDKSVEAYRKLLAQPDIPEALEISTLYGIAQLSLVTEDYSGAAAYLERWFRLVPDAGPDAYVLLSQAYYQQGEHEKALRPLNTAMNLARERGRPIKENWWLMSRALNFELGHYGRVVEALEALLTDYPRKEYWVQLAAMYGQTGQEKKQLVAYEIANEQGLLTQERELVLLAQLYLQQDVPYKAARVLEDGMENGRIEQKARNMRLLSQAWMLAQESENAIDALRAAAASSDDPELYLRLAQQYAGLSQWQNALEAAETALEKNVEAKGETHMLMGMAQFNLDRLDRARRSFRAATGFERNAPSAQQWIEHIDREQARKEQLARSM